MRHYYRQRLRVLVRSSAAPYGFNLATWTAGAVLTSMQGIPGIPAILMFMLGATIGFAFVGTLSFGGVTSHFERDDGDPPVVWGSFHFFSVGLAIGVAALVAYFVESFIAWPLGGFLYTTVYLLVTGAESAAAYWWDHQKGE